MTSVIGKLRPVSEFFVLLSAMMQSHRQRSALCIAGQDISYETLDKLSRRIADRLDGTMVAILADSSFETYAGVLATARSGRTYLPLNAAFPDDRLLKIIDIARPDTVLVDSKRIDQAYRLLRQIERPMRVVLGGAGPVRDRWSDLVWHDIVLIGDQEAKDTPPADAVDVVVDDATPLYLMFTSGTTGEPKGISIPRSNIVDYLRSIRELFDIGPADRCSHFFKLSFDLSVHDLYATWTSGACLHVPGPMDHLDPVAFARRSQLTIWFSVPSLVSLAMNSRKLRPGSLASLRLVLFCGEALSWEAADAFRAAAPEAKIANLYGPTETTIAITHYTLPPDTELSGAAAGDSGPISDRRRRSVPIGKPFPGQEAIVVGTDLAILPHDQLGELLLGGSQLAIGYLNDPDQTEERFLALDIAGRSSRRWYRTGDLAISTPDGLVFAGRLDNQIKFRGHRIELTEIEAALQQAAGTPLAIVVPWPPYDQGKAVEELIAFVMPPHPSARDLHMRLRAKLPAHMVPARIITIDHPPTSILNDNQKIDRGRLVDMYRERVA